MTHCIKVTNAGDSLLVNVSVTNPILSLERNIPVLESGKTVLLVVTRLVLGNETNVAFATGVPAFADLTPIPNLNVTTASDEASIIAKRFVKPSPFPLSSVPSLSPSADPSGEPSFEIIETPAPTVLAPSIRVANTVLPGFVKDPESCPGDDVITVKAGDPVTFCLTVANDGGMPLIVVSFVNLDLGLSEFIPVIESGENATFLIGSFISANFTSTAVATGMPAFDASTPVPGAPFLTDVDDSTVVVVEEHLSFYPTTSPTNKPSMLSTTAPTVPTFSTLSPTTPLTVNPSTFPLTNFPSDVPSSLTSSPTTPNTVNPSTLQPTNLPNLVPGSSTPTIRPTVNPSTVQPTNFPTPVPSATTVDPTTRPTVNPSTVQPTNFPTPVPSATTADPTTRPTVNPSTVQPTNFPTFVPSATTVDPTTPPTGNPSTLQPTKLPTPVPSSTQPITTPTMPPSTSPPSNSPTAIPSTSTAEPTTTLTPTSSQMPTQCVETFLIDFEKDGLGFPLEKGAVIDDSVILDGGVTFKGRRIERGASDAYLDAMIFDTRFPSENNTALAKVHPSQRKILILSANINLSEPEFAAQGGRFVITFEATVTVHSLKLVNCRGSAVLRFFGSKDGSPFRFLTIPGDRERSVRTVSLEVTGVKSFSVSLTTPGALDDVRFTRPCPTSEPTFSPTEGPTCPLHDSTTTFEVDAFGEILHAGSMVNETVAFDGGATYKGRRAQDGPDGPFNAGMIFDTTMVTGNDKDLGKSPERRNVLIITEDFDSDDPDDNSRGGIIVANYTRPVMLEAVRFVDTEDEGGIIEAFDELGKLLASAAIPVTGNGIVSRVVIEARGVSSAVVTLVGSGAIDDVEIMSSLESCQPSITPSSMPTT